MAITVGEAATQLVVTQQRVRAPLAAGNLDGRKVGPLWLTDEQSVTRQAQLTAAGATGRPMSIRSAWAAADLADGGAAAWIGDSERSRLRSRLREVSSIETVRRWLSRRATGSAVRYRVGERDLADISRDDAVVVTGVSATDTYGLGVGTGGTAAAYTTVDEAARLVRDCYLIESRTGNLALRIVDHGLHRASAHRIDGRWIAPRLIAGVDLADDRDARTRAAGRSLIETVLSERKWG